MPKLIATPAHPNQPPARIIENPPAKTVEKALANGKAQVEAAKQR